MGCIGTFEWAKDEFENVKRDFQRITTKADFSQCSIREYAGKENLAPLLARLDEVIPILGQSKELADKQQYEMAYALYDTIQAAIYG
ncbi:hypothetical protein IJS18_01730 [Candidatus Saccharibacteria bacterium]|nr:hypothetical protein [Candidatus Saccharibacteria bacterium]